MYIDPNASTPNTQPTTSGTGTGVGGVIGSSLNDVIAAANSGSLRVDPATGDATIRAITDIQAELNEVVRRMSRGSRQTKLGGGYAQQIDSFNQEWTVSGDGSAAGALEQFRRELLRLEDAVRKCMATYEASDAAGVRYIGQVNEGR